MINSRKLIDLLPPVADRAQRLIDLCKEKDIGLIITSTYRDIECQNVLYANGRDIPGPVKTYAKGGDSWHNWNRAFDVVPVLHGKLLWSIRGHDKDVWREVGRIGMSLGLEWGGSWTRHPDYCHFQDKMGTSLYNLKKAAGLLKK